MENHYVISIDLGTTNVKAAIVGWDGALVSTATAAVSLIHVDDDGVEQDPEAVWTTIKNLVRRLVVASEIPGSQIFGVITCAHYASVVPVDRNGRPTMNFIVHLDRRSSTAKLKHYPGFRRDRPWQQLKWLRRAGLPPLSSGVDTLSRMRLVKYAFPDVYSRTCTFLEPVDFVTMRFSGRQTASQCTALTMLGTDNNRHDRTTYDSDLVRMSRIDADKWPELVADNSVVGRIRPQLAAELGLSPATKVFSGVNDTQASGIGAGAFTGSQAAIGIGTTGVIITHTDRRKTDLLRGMVSLPAPIRDKYFVLAKRDWQAR